MVAAAIGGSAAISGITSLVGGSKSASGAQQAASTEAAATQQAIQAEQQMFQQAYGLEAPYATTGTTTEQELLGEMGLASLYGGTNTGGNFSGTGDYLGNMPSLTDASKLPGYNFTLQQGMNATNNAMTAQGLAAVPGGGNYSGAQMKGNIAYAEGLANTYYNNYLSNYWTNQNNRYNMLAGLVNTGQAAAGNLGQQATQAGGNIAATGQAGANSIAAAQQAGANAQAAGISGLGSSAGNALTAAALFGNQGGSTINSFGETLSPGEGDFGGVG